MLAILITPAALLELLYVSTAIILAISRRYRRDKRPLHPDRGLTRIMPLCSCPTAQLGELSSLVAGPTRGPELRRNG